MLTELSLYVDNYLSLKSESSQTLFVVIDCAPEKHLDIFWWPRSQIECKPVLHLVLHISHIGIAINWEKSMVVPSQMAGQLRADSGCGIGSCTPLWRATQHVLPARRVSALNRSVPGWHDGGRACGAATGPSPHASPAGWSRIGSIRRVAWLRSL